MFITGVVPLTDAVVELGGKAVFRTLVKDLPAAAGNSYAYSYGEQQNVPFYLHDAQACLWLPDYGRSEELRFTVSGTGGSSTEYTAGNITTVTQRTEAIPRHSVGRWWHVSSTATVRDEPGFQHTTGSLPGQPLRPGRRYRHRFRRKPR